MSFGGPETSHGVIWTIESFFRPDELSSGLKVSVLQLTQRTNMVVYTELANAIIWVCRFCNKVSELTIGLSLKGVRT